MDEGADLEDLVERSIARDPEAFGRLVTLLTTFVESIVRRHVRDPHDASEVANDVFVHVWYGLPRLDRPETFRSWLLAVTIRRILMHHRGRSTRKRRLLAGDGDPRDAIDRSTPLEEALRAELRAEVLRLPPEQARLVDERYFQELTLREIAEPRDLTIDQAFRALRRAIGRLGDRLSR